MRVRRLLAGWGVLLSKLRSHGLLFPYLAAAPPVPGALTPLSSLYLTRP